MSWSGAGPRVLALIPGYQEGPRIAAVVRGALVHLPVLVVDDGSTDDTAAEAEAAGARVIRQVPNGGKGAALRAGFRVALDEGWDAVVTLDADGQHDPAEIPRFLAALAADAYAPGEARAGSGAALLDEARAPGEGPGAGAARAARAPGEARAGSGAALLDEARAPGEGPGAGLLSDAAELVIGRRDFGRMPPARRVANTLGTAAFSWAVGRHIPDNQSGYRLLGRRLMAAMLDSRERGFEFEVEMIAVCLRRAWPLRWVPISTIYAGAPSHVRPLTHVRHFVRATRAARRLMRASDAQP